MGLWIITIITAVLFVTWIVLIYIRKTLWDAVHRNLLDLVDTYNGKIDRRSYASRPVFKGKISDIDFTVSFSSGKSSGKRRNYINFSFDLSASVLLTIAEHDWLIENEGKTDGLTRLQLTDDKIYLIRPANNRKIERLTDKEDFRRALSQFDNLAYFFVGKSGTLCEFYTERVDQDSKFDNLQKILNQIMLLIRTLNF